MTTIGSDDFNRANSTGLGANWTAITSESDWNVSSSTAVPSSLGGDCGVRWSANTFPNDQWSQADITVTGGTPADQAGPGPAIRIASGAQTLYRVAIDHGATNNIDVQKFVGGGFSDVGQQTQAFTNGDTFYLEAQSTTLTIKRNGVALTTTYTDSGVTAGSAGLSYSSASTAPSVDNWVGGDFTSSGGLPPGLGPNVGMEVQAMASTQAAMMR